ncbi:hypothetical protein [Aeoliella mucimassa]|uniref:Uncharacterized protein n=1 Tax=Aeoliella mucimassa TaxID=2527972 RepID=A0A518AIA0_9BACT|nr:hypothetical protein [Aeoliella mucimassa]QDU54404.1 hypothetical protein Pan181_05850 [Aeoliella mucimassa]
MWCQQCGQDVPAISTEGGVPGACPRCGHASARTASKVAEPVLVAEASDDWHSERRMRHIGRSLRTPLAAGKRTASDDAIHWLDMTAVPSTDQSKRNYPSTKSTRRKKLMKRPADYRMQWFAWFAVSVGLGLVAGGVGLMGMGLFGEDNGFWQWGVGVALAGQALLIAGLIRVLTSLWNNSRLATRRLIDIEQDLAEVGRTAEAIIARQAGGSSVFYGELARGASPTLLMANLKGQIDHLATRLHQDV